MDWYYTDWYYTDWYYTDWYYMDWYFTDRYYGLILYGLMLYGLICHALGAIQIYATERITARKNATRLNDVLFFQQHVIRMVPVTQCFCKRRGKEFTFYVYGLESKVHAPEYPDQCCWGCTILWPVLLGLHHPVTCWVMWSNSLNNVIWTWNSTLMITTYVDNLHCYCFRGFFKMVQNKS